MESKAFLYINMIKIPLSYDVTCFDIDGHDVSLKFKTNDDGVFKALKEISKGKLYVTYSLEVVHEGDSYLFTPIQLVDYDLLRVYSVNIPVGIGVFSIDDMNSVVNTWELILRFKYFNEIKDNEHKI